MFYLCFSFTRSLAFDATRSAFKRAIVRRDSDLFDGGGGEGGGRGGGGGGGVIHHYHHDHIT